MFLGNTSIYLQPNCAVTIWQMLNNKLPWPVSWLKLHRIKNHRLPSVEEHVGSKKAQELHSLSMPAPNKPNTALSGQSLHVAKLSALDAG